MRNLVLSIMRKQFSDQLYNNMERIIYLHSEFGISCFIRLNIRVSVRPSQNPQISQMSLGMKGNI